MKASMFLAGAAALAASGCATPGPPRTDAAVTLTGLQAFPGPGDPDGTGTAEIRVQPAQSRVCWTLFVREIEPATGAHIHRGAPGTAGPPVVPLATPDAAGRSSGCAAVDPALAREMTMQPHEFYVNVHNAAYPAGAIRGQLRGAANPPRRVPETR
jgi:hypothetical protein